MRWKQNGSKCMKFMKIHASTAEKTLFSLGTIVVPCGDLIPVGMLVLRGSLVSFLGALVPYGMNDFKSNVPGDGDLVSRRF
mmetsp:Transcript_590/g.1058  ORF Transcript_590/g.1058 Transcript_590/m.1058 type:complete len:81 (-) Transcript_590:130-372(-)|eukprot:CAMPEP_0176483024 /NCGR_PEP_ID=MMETSP0200_2-20121128/3701_1 /TAXON_ID=947934 /ORGANISM="Chaetoceros sp., Strain GSL56" /LENGTH=80 /DNA_ID=CAMNT_0017879405 /DNA_START=307 /DNA_END=549 /DNA_ORIENTATION=-